MKTEKLNWYIKVVLWSISFIIWCFWVRERIEIFSWFVDGYKNIGFYIDTNDNQLSWYILISVGKAILVSSILYFILPKYQFTKSAFIAIFILLGALLITEYLVAKGLFIFFKTNENIDLKLKWNYYPISLFIIYLVYALAAITLFAANKWIIEYRNLKTLHATQQAYVQLRKKLDPHFIFNTINNMYEVAVVSGDEHIQNSLLHLTDTLRYTLEASDKSIVSLSDEIYAIKSYIELQKARFEEGEVKLELEIDIENPSIEISPLILLNYIENAFEHGYKFGGKNSIAIYLTEKADELNLEIKNTNWAQRRNDNGGNLKTKQLLEIIYPKKHCLTFTKSEEFYNLHLWMLLK